MKIEKTGSSSTAALGEAGSRGSTARTKGKTTTSGSTDATSVHLGSTTAQLRSLESSIASSPVVDADKVAEIKQAITEGRFQVNSGVVADRLINSVQELITASKH